MSSEIWNLGSSGSAEQPADDSEDRVLNGLLRSVSLRDFLLKSGVN